MFETFNINDLEKAEYFVGLINKEVIGLLGLSICESKVMFSAKRIRHTKKHEEQYSSYDEYKNSIESVTQILNSPEYVGLSPDGNSLRYVCTGKPIVLIAIGIDGTNEQWIKTMYPITEDKLKMYVTSGQLVKIR